MSDSRHVMKATLDVLAVVEEAKKAGGAPVTAPESQAFPYQPLPEGQVKSLSAAEMATALDAMGAPSLPAVKLRVKDDKGKIVEGTAVSIAMQVGATGRRLKVVEEAIRANVPPDVWPKVGAYHRTNGNLVAILTMLTKAITATNASVRKPVPRDIADEVAVLRKQLASPQAPYTPMFTQEEFPVDGMRDITISKLFRPNDKMTVKVNPKSDAGIYYRSKNAMQKVVKNEDVIVQATQDLKWFLANLVAQKNNYSAALKAMYNTDPLRFLVMMKAKNELMKVANWLTKQRIINVFPLWESLLGQCVLSRTWKRVKNFIEDPSSSFMHNAGWHNGNARLFIQRLLNLGEGLWLVNAGDDSLWVFVQLDVVNVDGRLTYVTVEGEPIQLDRPWACEIPQNVRKRMVIAAPDAERFDLRLLSAVWGFCVNRDIKSYSVGPSSLMEFLMKFMSFRVFNADCLFHRSIVARLINVLKAGHAATTCFNTSIMRDLNQTHKRAWEVSENQTFAFHVEEVKAAEPEMPVVPAPSVEPEAPKEYITTKFGDVVEKKIDKNFNMGVATTVQDYSANAKAADEARRNPKPLVFGANRYTAKALRAPEGAMGDHPDLRFGGRYDVVLPPRVLDVSLAEEFLRRRARIITALGMAYKEETLVAEEFDQLHPKINLPFLGHRIVPHTFEVGSQRVDSYIAVYADPAKSLASLLNAPIRQGDEAGPPILAVLMSQAVCIALGNCTDSRVYAVCKQVFEHGAKAGNYPVVSEDYLDGFAMTDDIDVEELLRLPKDVKLPSFPEMSRLQLFSEDRVLRGSLGPMYFNVHGYAPPPKPGAMQQEVADVNPFASLSDETVLPATIGGTAGLIQANIDSTDRRHFGQLVETEEHKLKRKEVLRQHAVNQAAAAERRERRNARDYGRDMPDDDAQSIAETEYALDEDVADLKEERRQAREDAQQDIMDEAHQRDRESPGLGGDDDTVSQAETEYNIDDVFDMRGGGDRLSDMGDEELERFLHDQMDTDEPATVIPNPAGRDPFELTAAANRIIEDARRVRDHGPYAAPSEYEIARMMAASPSSGDSRPVSPRRPPTPVQRVFPGLRVPLTEHAANIVHDHLTQTFERRTDRGEWINNVRAREARSIALGLPEVPERPVHGNSIVRMLTPRGVDRGIVDTPAWHVNETPVVPAPEVYTRGPMYCWTCESVSCYCGKNATHFYYAEHELPPRRVVATRDEVKSPGLQEDEPFDVHSVVRGDLIGPLKSEDAYLAATWIKGNAQIEATRRGMRAVVAELNARNDHARAIEFAVAVEHEYCGRCGELACTCCDVSDFFNVGEDSEYTYTCSNHLADDPTRCFTCDARRAGEVVSYTGRVAHCRLCGHCLCTHCHTKHLRYCPPLMELAIDESKRLRKKMSAVDRNFSKHFWLHYARLASRARAEVLYTENQIEGRESLRDFWCICPFCKAPLFPSIDHAFNCEQYRTLRAEQITDVRRKERVVSDERISAFIELHAERAPGAAGLPRKMLDCIFMAPKENQAKIAKRKLKNAKRNAKRKAKRQAERECLKKQVAAPAARVEVGHGDYKTMIGAAAGAAAPYLRKGARWLIDRGAKWLHGLVGEGDYQWKDTPIAQNSLWARSTGPPAVLSSPDNPNIMRGREKLLNVFSSNAFKHSEVSINPGVAFPWLPPVASAYQRYIVRGMIFEYVKAINSMNTGNVDGRVVLGARYDLNIAPPVNIDQAEEADWAVPLDPMKPGIMGVECAPRYRPVNVLNVRLADLPDGVDAQFFDFIKFDLCQEGQTGAADTLIGEVWCSYEIELVSRIADHVVNPNKNSVVWQSDTTIQDTKPFLASATFTQLYNDEFKFQRLSDTKMQCNLPSGDSPGTRYAVQAIQVSTGASVTGVALTRTYNGCTLAGTQFLKQAGGTGVNELYTAGVNTSFAFASGTNFDTFVTKTSAKGVPAYFTIDYNVTSTAATTVGVMQVIVSYFAVGISVDERMRARFPQIYAEAERRAAEAERIANFEQELMAIRRGMMSGAIPPPRSESADDGQSVDMCN